MSGGRIGDVVEVAVFVVGFVVRMLRRLIGGVALNYIEMG